MVKPAMIIRLCFLVIPTTIAVYAKNSSRIAPILLLGIYNAFILYSLWRSFKEEERNGLIAPNTASSADDINSPIPLDPPSYTEKVDLSVQAVWSDHCVSRNSNFDVFLNFRVVAFNIIKLIWILQCHFDKYSYKTRILRGIRSMRGHLGIVDNMERAWWIRALSLPIIFNKEIPKKSVLSARDRPMTSSFRGSENG